MNRSVHISLSFAVLTLLPAAALAHDGTAYSHDSNVKTNNPDWMAGIRGDVTLSQLSIPGTHDSMAHYGGDVAWTQTLSLSDQLQSGIRAVDIRCRHINNACAIHHGVIYQNANLTDVLTAITTFLKAHPGETVLMRLKTGETDDSGDTRSFEDTWREYQNTFSAWVWTGTSQNPKLDDVRGKIVVLQNFGSQTANYGLSYSNAFNTQDDYQVSTQPALYAKWTSVKKQLAAAESGAQGQLYMNYLSGADGVFPYFVVSGQGSPATGLDALVTGKTTPAFNDWPDFPRINCALGMCTIAYEGTDILTMQWLGKNPGRVGTIMADFPGPSLIQAILAQNLSLAKAPPPSASVDVRYAYRLSNRYLGADRALDTYANGTNQPFMGNSKDNTTGQAWIFIPFGDGTFRMENNFLGIERALDTYANGDHQGFMTSTNSDTSGQHWTLVAQADGSYLLENAFTRAGAALDTYANGDHQPFMSQPPGNFSGQFWTLTRLFSLGAPLGTDNGKCLDVSGGDYDHRVNGAKVQVWDCWGGPNQSFRWDGKRLVTPTGKCLDVDGGAYSRKDNGGKVQLWDCNGGPTQNWHWDGKRLMTDSGKCLDIDGGDYSKNVNGAKVQQWDCNGGPNQEWSSR